MSDLIEKVETAIEYQIQNHGFGPHVSRAAIAAVAEWMSEDPKAEQCCRDTISGALAAELKRIQK